MKNKETTTAFFGVLLMAGMLPAGLAAEAPTQPAATPQSHALAPESVDVEVFQGAHVLRGPGSNLYPKYEGMDGREGWVVLNMMIDPNGKPYEPMVVDSSGNPAFEKAALKGLDQVVFEPARRDGTPIDSSLTFKMVFAMDQPAKGASRAFVANYRLFAKAVDAGDKVKADARMAHIDPQNLYEDAFANFARYSYDARWGTPEEQLRDVTRALANESKPGYLPKGAFAIVAAAKFRLEVLASDYGRALETWEILEPVAAPDLRAQAQGVVDQLRALQAGNEPVRRSAVIGRYNSWAGVLFRNRFNISVMSGSVSEIKLRCAKQYLFFKYEPDVQYSIGTQKDHCDIEVVGEPGTKFELVQ